MAILTTLENCTGGAELLAIAEVKLKVLEVQARQLLWKVLGYCPHACLADGATREAEIQARQLLWKVLGYRPRAFFADAAAREVDVYR